MQHKKKCQRSKTNVHAHTHTWERALLKHLINLPHAALRLIVFIQVLHGMRALAFENFLSILPQPESNPNRDSNWDQHHQTPQQNVVNAVHTPDAGDSIICHQKLVAAIDLVAVD